MPTRRVALEFTFDEWEDLGDIIAGIEIPDAMEEEQVLLHEDDIHLAMATDASLQCIENACEIFSFIIAVHCCL